jgi:putative ABC transport system permease protein
MFLRLLAESLRRGRRRKLLAATAVALGTFAVTALGTVLLSAGDRLAAQLGSYGANIQVVPDAGRETFAVENLDRLRKIFWKHNIVAAAPIYPLRVRFAPAGVVAPLVGTWFDHPLDAEFRTGLPAVRPALQVRGRWPRDDAYEVVLGRRLASRLGASTGDAIQVELNSERSTLRVVGTLASGGDEDDEAFVPLSVVQALAGRPGQAVRAEIFALTVPETSTGAPDPSGLSPEDFETWYCTAYPSSIAHQIGEALPDARAKVVRAVAGASGEILTRLRQVLLLLASVVLIGTAVGVTAAMTATVLERRLEAGLLAALGAERRQIALFFLTEAGILGLSGGLIGGLLGLVAGRLLGRGVFGLEVPWMPALLPVALGLGLAVAVAGSLPPVTRALRTHPARTLARATA